MKWILTFILFTFLSSNVCSQVNFYISEDKSYQLQIPNSWERLTYKESSANPIYLEPPSSGKITSSYTLDITLVPKKLIGADIEKIAEEQFKKLSNQAGYKPVFQSRSFTTIHNQKWWKAIYTISASSSATKTIMYVTLFNGNIYTLKYEALENDFNTQSYLVENSANSFMFYKSNFSDISKVHDVKKVGEILKPYEGRYTFKIVESNTFYIHTIDITRNDNGETRAVEIRKLLNDNNDTVTFFAQLIPEITNDNSLQLLTDRIYSIDNSKPWQKAAFTINKKNDVLEVLMASRNQSFEPYKMEMLNELNLVKKGDLEQESMVSNKFEVDNKSEIKGGLSCGNVEVEDIDEKQNIISCGEGKVSRINKGSLQINTNSKTVLLNDNQSELDDAYKYTFIGKADDLKAFVIKMESMENSVFIIVNKINGSQISLPDLNYKISKNGKFVAAFQSDIINEMEETAVYIYSVFDAGFRQVFKQNTFINGNGWGPSAIAWSDDNTLEIDKEVVANLENEETKSSGKTWLQFSGGKWIWKNSNSKDGTLPYVRLKEAKPAASADALGRAVFNAVRTNNKQAYYDLIHIGTLEEATKGLSQIRKDLEAKGVANFDLLQYSRVKFSSNKSRYVKDAEVYEFVNIEFTYGKDFVGAIRGELNSGNLVIIKDKYLLYKPLNQGVLYRKEKYR